MRIRTNNCFIRRTISNNFYCLDFSSCSQCLNLNPNRHILALYKLCIEWHASINLHLLNEMHISYVFYSCVNILPDAIPHIHTINKCKMT